MNVCIYIQYIYFGVLLQKILTLYFNMNYEKALIFFKASMKSTPRYRCVSVLSRLIPTPFVCFLIVLY